MLASTSLVIVAPAARAVPSLLTSDAPREALVAPLEERGWSVNEAALRTVLTDAQGYPFFLQLWGRALWEAGVSLKARRLLDGGKTPLTTGQLKQCLNDCGVDSDSRKALETLFEHSDFLVDLGNNKWGPGIPSLVNYVCELTTSAIPGGNRNEGAPPR